MNERTLIGLFVGVFGCATSADAAVETSIGVSPRDAALGGSYAARSDTYAATYYNPANLVGRLELDAAYEIGVGTVYGQPFVQVESLDGEPMTVSKPPRSTRGFQFGGRFDVAAIDDLRLGFAAFLPPRAFEFSVRPDEELQWFGLSDDDRFSVNAGLGWSPLPWLALGVGARLLFEIEVVTTARVVDVEATEDDEGDASFQTSARFGEEAAIRPRVAPLAGISVRPAAATSVGLAYRGKLMADEFGSTQIDGVPGLPALGYDHFFTHFFEPHRVTLAVAQRLGRWSLSADLEYARWSDAMTTNQNFPGLGFFGDTFNPSVGIAWTATDGLDLLAGYRYAPSPWDNFGGRSNVLSNDEHAASGGLEFDFRKLHPGAEFPVSLSWALRVRSLVARTETKDWRAFDSDARLEANPGSPGYRYGGVVVASSLGLGVAW